MILIQFHSVVDVITNSSTVIYTRAKSNAIGMLRQLVNALMAATSSDLTADDMFEFKLETVPKDYVWNDFRAWYVGNLPRVHDGNEYVDAPSWQHFVDLEVKPPWWNDAEELGMYDVHSDVYIRVTAKDPQAAHAARVMERLHDIFEQPEVSTE